MENKNCVDCKDELVKAVQGNDFLQAYYIHHVF